MDIVLSPTNGMPLYRQLYLQISSQIVNQVLLPGTALPPIRTIAAELGVSIITVKRAWEELERDGFIVTNVGRGTFVAQRAVPDPNQKKQSMARDQLRTDLEFYRTLGLSQQELIALIQEIYQDPTA